MREWTWNWKKGRIGRRKCGGYGRRRRGLKEVGKNGLRRGTN